MDLLKLDYINSLPQPFMVRKYGSKDWWWPLHDIDVQTGMLRFDVCGKLEVSHISDIAIFKDMDGVEHEADTFYSDYNNAA